MTTVDPNSGASQAPEFLKHEKRTNTDKSLPVTVESPLSESKVQLSSKKIIKSDEHPISVPIIPERKIEDPIKISLNKIKDKLGNNEISYEECERLLNDPSLNSRDKLCLLEQAKNNQLDTMIIIAEIDNSKLIEIFSNLDKQSLELKEFGIDLLLEYHQFDLNFISDNILDLAPNIQTRYQIADRLIKQNNGRDISRSIDKFQLQSRQDLLLDIAMKLVPHHFKPIIDYLDQEHRTKLALEVLKTEFYDINIFKINDANALKQVALTTANRYPGYILRYEEKPIRGYSNTETIPEFPNAFAYITDDPAINRAIVLELAKSKEFTIKILKHFRITDQETIQKIAYLQALANSNNFINEFQHYEIKDQKTKKELIDIATNVVIEKINTLNKLCTLVEDYNEKDKVELFKKLLKIHENSNSQTTTKYLFTEIDKFINIKTSITDEFVKYCAGYGGFLFILDKLNIEDSELLFEVAKKQRALREYNYDTIFWDNLSKFKIDIYDKEKIYELLKIEAYHSPVFAGIAYLEKLAINDEEKFNLATIHANQFVASLNRLNSFNLPLALYEKVLDKTHAYSLIVYFAKLLERKDLDPSILRKMMSKALAWSLKSADRLQDQHGFYSNVSYIRNTTNSIKNFISSLEKTKASGNHNPDNINALGDNHLKLSILLKPNVEGAVRPDFQTGVYNPTIAKNIILEWGNAHKIKPELLNAIFSKLEFSIKDGKSIPLEPHVININFEWLLSSLVYFSTIQMPESEVKAKLNLFLDVLGLCTSIHNPALRKQIVGSTLIMLNDPKAWEIYNVLRKEKSAKMFLLSQISLACLSTKGVSAETIKETLKSIASIKGEAIKDRKFNEPLFKFIDILLTSNLSPSHISGVLAYVFEPDLRARADLKQKLKTIANLPLNERVKKHMEILAEGAISKTETIKRLNLLKGIANISSSQELIGQKIEANKDNLNEYFIQFFSKVIPVNKDRPNFTELLEERFGKSRNPEALFQYAAVLSTLTSDKEVALKALAKFVDDVLDGIDVYKLRRVEENNPHLDSIFADNPHLKPLWMQGLKKKWEELNITKSKSKSVDISEILHFAIQDEHYKLPFLKAYLESNKEKSVIDDLNKAINSTNEGAEKNTLLAQKVLIEMCQNHFHHLSQENQQMKINEVIALLELPEHHDFYHNLADISQKLKTTKSENNGMVVVDTDDPIDLLLCGTDITGSCQRVNGDATNNRGLLGYLLDGKIRLLAVKDSSGKIQARSILRLMKDNKTGKPVLFLARLYSSDDSHDDAIIQMAKEKAALMNLPLLANEVGTGESGNSLVSDGADAPFEYVDGAGGIKVEGKYTVSGARYLNEIR